MMQNMNFYLAFKKPGRYTLTGERAKTWMIGWVIFLLFISVIQLSIFLFQKTSLWYFENNREAFPEKMRALEDASPSIKKIIALTQEIKKLERTLILRNDLLRNIAPNNYTTVFVMSDDFRAIALAIPEKVWLTKMMFEDRGKTITLSGKTTNAEQLLRFTDALEKQDSFRHHAWSLVTTPVNAQQEKAVETLSFKIASKVV
ncbi:MAG: hypothetical protein A3E84_00320 [Gammaproteobacteria bacterium RIFCSPHIGHO2_12_FULL_42_13]|nr:MAG: hypothetical protein A3E84_00320 [Gammaproteobacteria bacterium RIFCSPHIGHO2_12_FULL_42_13]